MLDYIAMGKRIRALRKEARMTQAAIAGRCGISVSFYGHIERGTRVTALDTVRTIADVLQVSIQYIVTGDREDRAGWVHMLTKTEILGGILRVLNDHSEEWLPAG